MKSITDSMSMSRLQLSCIIKNTYLKSAKYFTKLEFTVCVLSLADICGQSATLRDNTNQCHQCHVFVSDLAHWISLSDSGLLCVQATLDYAVFIDKWFASLDSDEMCLLEEGVHIISSLVQRPWDNVVLGTTKLSLCRWPCRCVWIRPNLSHSK